MKHPSILQNHKPTNNCSQIPNCKIIQLQHISTNTAQFTISNYKIIQLQHISIKTSEFTIPNYNFKTHYTIQQTKSTKSKSLHYITYKNHKISIKQTKFITKQRTITTLPNTNQRSRKFAYLYIYTYIHVLTDRDKVCV